MRYGVLTVAALMALGNALPIAEPEVNSFFLALLLWIA